MKKLTFLLVITFFTIFISCNKAKDDSSSTSKGSITIGDQTIPLKTGRSIYYGIDAAYNTDLFISTLSQADIEALTKIELSEGLFTALEEYEVAYKEILGDQTVGTFYIQALSDIIEKLSVSTDAKPDNSESFAYTDAQFSYGDDIYYLYGKLKVIQSSKDYYELKFLGKTTDSTAVSLNFKGDFIYKDDVLGIIASSKSDDSSIKESNQIK